MTERNRRLRILWVTPKWLFPANDGARIASTQLLKNLSLKEVDLHLCAIVQEDEKIAEKKAMQELGVDSVSLVRRKKSSSLQRVFHLLKNPFFPVTLAPYATREVVDQMMKIIQAKKFDLVVYDGLHASAWRAFAPSVLPLNEMAYRAHNVESDLWFRGALETSNLLKKAALFGQGKLVKKVETCLARESHYLFPVSLTDELKFRKYDLSGKVKTLPIGMQIRSDTALLSSVLEPKTRNLLFVGRLDWAPNREGLRWVLKNVWMKAKERAPDLELTIVGSGDRTWLEPYLNLPGVRVLGQVEKLTPHYEACIATLVPIFYGSGTRVKAIESSLYGRACVSTELGVEGMGLVRGEHYYSAETIEEWVQCLVSLDIKAALEVGRRAQLQSERTFNPIHIADRFMETVVQ